MRKQFFSIKCNECDSSIEVCLDGLKMQHRMYCDGCNTDITKLNKKDIVFVDCDTHHYINDIHVRPDYYEISTKVKEFCSMECFEKWKKANGSSYDEVHINKRYNS